MHRILIVGCGDVARRTLPMLARRYRVYALVRRTDSLPSLELARMGVTPIRGDLDYPASLRRLAGLADIVLHFAPPPGEFGAVVQPSLTAPALAAKSPKGALSNAEDPRTRHLIAALSRAKKILPRRVIYISTSGVYGDCAGAVAPETRPLRPSSARALRRIDAENQLRAWSKRGGPRVAILRVPGIYAGNRLPLQRVRRGDPALRQEDDVYTHHIPADDLARVCVAALRRGRPNRSYNVCDNSGLRMADWFDCVADAFELPRPPRVSKAQAAAALSPAMMSFLNESRRLDNTRLLRELRVKLIYPDVAAGLAVRKEP